jgi:hypothetical protein
MKWGLGLVFSVVFLSGCVTNSFYTSKNLAPETKRIALVSPDVELSLMNAGGINEPQAEWTKLAEKHLSSSIRKKLQSLNVQLIDNQTTRELETEDTKEVQLLKLHEAVGATILTHQYIPQLRLPSKRGEFTWSLGNNVRYLKDKYGAEYALFIYVRDSYTSGGRAAAIVVAALFGVGIQGGTQVGFASLVDLNSGDIVWFNRLLRAAGDLRTSESTDETVTLLLDNFPQ